MEHNYGESQLKKQFKQLYNTQSEHRIRQAKYDDNLVRLKNNSQMGPDEESRRQLCPRTTASMHSVKNYLTNP